MSIVTRFEEVHYKSLKARQKELFNFQKVAATFADLGFASSWRMTRRELIFSPTTSTEQ